VEVRIKVRCPKDRRVEDCRNNKFVYVNNPAGKSAHLTYLDTEPLPGRSYYYVRVIQKDNEMAWSSPVWLEPPGIPATAVARSDAGGCGVALGWRRNPAVTVRAVAARLVA
jgi:hypothetical protein